MKRTLLRSWLLCLSVLAAAISCKPQQKPLLPELELQPTALEVPAEGGTFGFDYIVRNPRTGAVPVAVSDKSWIRDFTVSEGRITFSADPNPAPESRTATVTVSYTEAAGARLAVTQSAAAPEEPAFRIEINGLTETEAFITVYPKDPGMTYVVTGIDKAYYEKLGNDQAVFDDLIQFFTEVAAMQGMSLEQLLRTGGVLRQGEVREFRLSNHLPGSENYALAIGMNAKGEQLSEVIKAYYRTKEVEKVEMGFDIAYDINGTTVTMEVTPTLDDHWYYFDCVTAEYAASSGKTPYEIASALLNDLIAQGRQTGLNVEETIRKYCSRSRDSYTFELNSRTGYIGYAFGCSLKGFVDTEVASREFSTGDVTPSENVITLELVEVNVDRVKIQTRTTNKDPYVLLVVRGSDISGLNDEQLLAELCSKNLINYTRIGDFTYEVGKLEKETAYAALAFGYRAGQPTTALIRKDFTTAPPEDPNRFTFSDKIGFVTHNSADITVTGTPNEILYYWDLRPAETTAEQFEAEVEATVRSYIDMGYAKDRLGVMKIIGRRGTDQYTFGKLETSREYRAMAVAIDETTGANAGPVCLGTAFFTREKRPSEITVRVIHDKIWDADQIAERYPKYSFYAGKGLYCLPVQIETSAEVHETFFMNPNKDYSDPAAYPDEELIRQLVDEGRGTPLRELYCFLPYNKDCSLIAAALDREGYYTAVYRELINHTADQAADINEFTPKFAPADRGPAASSAYASRRDQLLSAGTPLLPIQPAASPGTDPEGPFAFPRASAAFRTATFFPAAYAPAGVTGYGYRPVPGPESSPRTVRDAEQRFRIHTDGTFSR